MGSLRFEGREIPLKEGDTVASALYRAGVRTFTRSLEYHRRRGLYCLTGDCPNCRVNVDGEPGVPACTTPVSEGMEVKREAGWPSADFDLLAVADRAHRLMPVGFYYKTFLRPRFAWPAAERLIRAATGVGRLPLDREPRKSEARHLHCGVLVIGGGVAGLAAAVAVAALGESVVLCDEGRLGEAVPPGPTLERIRSLEGELGGSPSATILERSTAVGIYEGPLVPVVGDRILLQIHPGRVVVATGAVETHAVFRGNDLPGVWLGRGAARLAGVHSVRPGRRAVVVARTAEGIEHLRTLLDAGVEVAAAVVPHGLAGRIPTGILAIRDATVVAAEGRKGVRAVVVDTDQVTRRIQCDALVLSLGFAPRDGLLRQGAGLPVLGAGDAVWPGCTLEEAVESGTKAGLGEADGGREPELPPVARAGYVCLCEDVSVEDLERAWAEGFRSSELLKRYTTATMGPCQGAMCGMHLASFATARSGSAEVGGRTTARPPARGVRLEELAGAVHGQIEKRTALHDRHIELGARVDWSGSWKRPYHYGDAVEEYRAVRGRVSVMDVGTLGKFLVAGDDATTLLDRVYPCAVETLAPGRARYALMLGQAGYLFDDGLICALGGARYYLTTTSGGAPHAEAWLRDWADRWGLHVHIVDQTAALGAILVAGPRARELLSRLCPDPIDREAFPYMAHREITVADVPCRAIRVGFVGELGFELHHPRSRSVHLWDALLGAGGDLGIRPHGLHALEVLRLEKGHVYIGQDTLPDSTPAKHGMDWAVSWDKPFFLGRVALQRMAERQVERKLVGVAFDGGARPRPGVPLFAGDRIVGRLTSCERSPALERAIGLAWLDRVDGAFPSEVRADGSDGRVVPTPFYDPEGARVRA